MVNRFLQEKFKVYERLHLHYLMYLGVESTLSSSKHPRKQDVGLTKRQLQSLKTVLVDSLADIRRQPDTRQRYLSDKKIVVEMGKRLACLRMEFDVDRAAFMIDNGSQLYRRQHHDTAIVKQHQRTLKRNLDFVILGVMFKSMTGKEIDIDAVRKKTRRSDFFAAANPELTGSVESLTNLYRFNKGLIAYIRDQMIMSLQPLLLEQKVKIDPDRFKDLVKHKIRLLIEGLYIKYPDNHQRVEFDNLASHQRQQTPG